MTLPAAAPPITPFQKSFFPRTPSATHCGVDTAREPRQSLLCSLWPRVCGAPAGRAQRTHVHSCEDAADGGERRAVDAHDAPRGHQRRPRLALQHLRHILRKQRAQGHAQQARKEGMDAAMATPSAARRTHRPGGGHCSHDASQHGAAASRGQRAEHAALWPLVDVAHRANEGGTGASLWVRPSRDEAVQQTMRKRTNVALSIIGAAPMRRPSLSRWAPAGRSARLRRRGHAQSWRAWRPAHPRLKAARQSS